METSKVVNLLNVVIDRLRKSQQLSREQFNICLDDSLSDVIHSDLEDIVRDLFNEHTNITGVINDLTDLRGTLEHFEFLVK